MTTVAALYQFTRFDDPAALRGPLLALCEAEGVRGTLLLAQEGINGTIAGTRAGIDTVLAHIRALPGCAALDWKESAAAEMPFGRMKVRLKREIVTMGEPDVDPRAGTGHYVEAADWNALISAPDVVVIDTRNDYEVGIGSFAGAVDPGTKSFREFPGWWRENAQQFEGKRVAMFCTGGIRCEKSTNFLMQEGVAEVFHLKGGILKYLEEVPETESLWQGECFVFDERVSVGHGLVPGTHGLCRACRRPLTAAGRNHADYEEGVSCAACRGEFSDDDRARFRERQRQSVLAEARGTRHLGADSAPSQRARKSLSFSNRAGATRDQS
ncbi:MAG: rhodanese-related sulfurtransferase [Albidovulum sp.]